TTYKRTRILNPPTGVSTMSAQQPATENAEVQDKDTAATRRWPRRGVIIKSALALLVVVILVAPWEASTGSDCALLLPPGREAAARANTDAVLTELFVQPGDTISQGTKIARLANPEIEDRLTQLTAEITRLESSSSRIEEELRVRSEMLLSANFTEVDRKRLATELNVEAGQIAGWEGRSADAEVGGATATIRPSGLLPASLAVLNSEVDLKQTELEHNRREVDRYKRLLDQGLVGEQQYDRAVAAVRITERELQGARARLEAGMVDHRRLTSGAQTSSLVAETEARAARSNFEALIAEMHANRQQLESLRHRRDILQREYDGMNVLSPKSGVVLGEDMRKMIGRRYSRGEEICRIGELERFLLRIDVSEREIGNVRLDSPVRFKLKTVPGRTFTGVVSKINAEPVPNQNGQMFYPVEVSVENSDGVLRPGMTGFARISFGRQSIGLIFAEKIWHSLRPELWLF
ncbi:MAG TPA: efflux RND transporter periplasmic adaptor subunit, partial [Blastocatellia bacterium]|nr:efflux RND transporter periplasmic adaptor subunit [Blastocatellia bacterium]